ncbi:AAA family ATPase [Lysobacter sp. FW306-1B-D06B]|uniref:AAA family ATPase n=1 Tax=Lysobacter sp. FW306-1B-D06B TaxID=3140250 RepID=UPI0031403917
MHIRSLEIRDLRSIKKAELDFMSTEHASKDSKFKNVNVLLGSNGTGKSTVLRAIAMSVLAPVLEGNSGFVSDGFIRRESNVKSRTRKAPASRGMPQRAQVESKVWVDPQDLSMNRNGRIHSLKAQIDRVGDNERLQWLRPRAQAAAILDTQSTRESSAFFLVGYGATRRVEHGRQVDFDARSQTRVTRYQRVASLFEEHYSLIPLSAWLPAYAARNPGRHKQVIQLLNHLLPDACRMHTTATETTSGPEYLFDVSGVDIPFRALSDGFRAYVGWIGDMLFHLCMGAPRGRKLVDNKGVVLIDEIDLHQHPEWQRLVLPRLSAALPNVQFIVSTHSPLVVGSLQRQNMQRLEVTTTGTVSRMLPERVHGKSAGQILLSPYFGLASTRAPDVASQLDELRSRRQAGAKGAALEYLRLLASGDL